MAAKKQQVEKEYTVEEKLAALYQLQAMVSEIDRIKTLRGELPLEVQDLEDEIAGLETRLEKYRTDVQELEASVAMQKNKITESTALIERYKAQLDSVRNNREFDNLSKEVEYQGLEIQFSEKKISEYSELISQKQEETAAQAEALEGRKSRSASENGRTGRDHCRNQAGRRKAQGKSQEARKCH